MVDFTWFCSSESCSRTGEAHLNQVRVCVAAQLGLAAHQHLGNGQVAMPQGSSQGSASPPVCEIHIGIIPASSATLEGHHLVCDLICSYT